MAAGFVTLKTTEAAREPLRAAMLQNVKQNNS
jgi:hypothetical protein